MARLQLSTRTLLYLLRYVSVRLTDDQYFRFLTGLSLATESLVSVE